MVITLVYIKTDGNWTWGKEVLIFPLATLGREIHFKSTSLLSPFSLKSHFGSTHPVHYPHKATEKCHVVGVYRSSWFPVEYYALSTVILPILPQTTLKIINIPQPFQAFTCAHPNVKAYQPPHCVCLVSPSRPGFCVPPRTWVWEMEKRNWPQLPTGFADLISTLVPKSNSGFPLFFGNLKRLS